MVFNLSDGQGTVAQHIPAGRWHKLLDSADRRWQGSGSIIPDQLESEEKATFTVNPLSFTVLTREN